MSYMTWTVKSIGENSFAFCAYDGDVNHLVGVSSGKLSTMIDTGNVPTNYCWEYEPAIGGGILLRNISSGLVLKYDGETVDVGAQLTNTHADYTDTVWGVLATSNFHLVQDIELLEDWLLPSSQKFFDYRTTPSYATWVMPRNFIWWMPTTNNFSVNQSGVVTAGANGGTITLRLTYKLTGQSWDFRITSGAVREGEYLIRNVRTGRYVDIKGPSKGNDVLLHQWQHHSGEWEKWRLTINELGDYSVQSVYSGKYIHVAGASTAAGANIVQYEGSVNANARWQIKIARGGHYRISPLSNLSMALGVPMGQDGDGVNLQQIPYGADSDYSDEWIFENIGPAPGIKNGGIYHIVAKHSNKALDVTGAGTTDGTVINQYPVTAGYQWQRWKFEYWGNGEYKIHDMNSDKLLSIASSSHTDGAISHIWTSDNTMGQLFKIRANDDGTYSFLSTCSNYIRALTVNGGSTANGANVIQSTDLGLDYQKFHLQESVADISFLYEPLNELCQYAEEYKELYNTSYSVNELVLQYIRHNVAEYTTARWAIVAGNIEQGFVNYVNNKNSFINVMFSGERPYSAGAFLYDPDGNEIDFYHMCATINGIKYDSTILDEVVGAVPDIYLNDLCGWAGDLQTLSIQVLEKTNYSDNYYEIYDKAWELIGHPDQEKSKLSCQDLLADMDAIPIASYPAGRISTIMAMYYMEGLSDYEEYRARFSIFVFFRTKSALYEYALSYTSRQSPILGIYWPFFEEVEITEMQSSAIAQAFTDIIWERAMEE